MVLDKLSPICLPQFSKLHGLTIFKLLPGQYDKIPQNYHSLWKMPIWIVKDYSVIPNIIWLIIFVGKKSSP